MKKLLIIGLIVLLAAAGASVMTGRVFEEQLANFEAEMNKDPRLDAVSHSVDTGLFSSSGSMTVSMYLEDNQQLIIESPWQASYLPGWVNYQGETLVTLAAEGEVINLLEELDLGELKYQGKAGWKKATFSMAVQPFLFEDKYAKLDLSGLDLAATYHYSGQQEGKLIAKNLILVEKNQQVTELAFKDLALTWDQQGSYPFVQGDAELKADEINFSSPQGVVNLAKSTWSQQLVFNEQNFDYSMSLDLGEIQSQGENLGTGKLSLKTANFNGQAMADLLELLATNPNYDQGEEATNQAVMAALDQLLGGSPAIELEELSLNIQMPFVLEQDAWGELSFDGTNLPVNYVQQLEIGRIDSDDALGRTRLELNFSKIEPGLLMLIGIPPSMLNSEADEQKLVFEAGVLELNGNPLPF
ncbi:DUF945 family protein [Marinospirillum insulare]|uniref:DUF945 domain-containing protein n=1 Tax=Marinospirillum insulare TaxID=217169 RepID=A0ABQ5ZT94_9GAMM|nr:DUF945 family protein [Marinospirillum insulare]GLR63355.1 hypothetical protein GCM10007878_07900 [Marinospirillum insulare]